MSDLEILMVADVRYTIQSIGLNQSFMLATINHSKENKSTITGNHSEWVRLCEYEKLKAKLDEAIKAGEFFSQHADCRKDSWGCKCSFCKNTTASKQLREAREFLATLEKKDE